MSATNSSPHRKHGKVNHDVQWSGGFRTMPSDMTRIWALRES